MRAITIRQLRERLGWTQTVLGEEVDCTQMCVSSWETGKSKPTGHFRKKVLELFEKHGFRMKEV